MRAPCLFALTLAASLAAAQTPPVRPSYPANTPLAVQIHALLTGPATAQAHWGIAVTALDGKPIYGLDEGKLFRPASTAKLFTTAAAMALLGPDDRFTTTVLAEGTLTHGVLHGNVVLHGGGDANFDGGSLLPYESPAERKLHPRDPPAPLADVDQLAADITDNGNLKVAFEAETSEPGPSEAGTSGTGTSAAGNVDAGTPDTEIGNEDLKVIEGDIVGDDTYFDDTPYAEGWSTDDLLWGYGAPVSALSVHDNQIDVALTPSRAGDGPATIALSPDLPYYRVNPHLPGGAYVPSLLTRGPGWPSLQRLDRAPGSHDLFVIGDIKPGQAPVHEQVAIDEPALYAAMALRAALERQGVVVKGTVRARHRPDGQLEPFFEESHEAVAMPPAMLESIFRGVKPTCEAQTVLGAGNTSRTPLSQHISAPLFQDVTLTLKTSQNLHAETMLRNISAELMCGSSLGRSAQIVRQWLIHAGIAPNDFDFYDGSGLSTKDLVTPRAEAQLLAFAVKQPWFAQWKAGLPVGGVDGTLAERFKTSPLKGHVFAKTGTLGESRALAGYLDCASGRQVIFSIMVDNHPPGDHADRDVMDRIVAAIAAAN